MADQLVPSGGGDEVVDPNVIAKAFASVIGAVQQQTELQKHAIDAEVEKHRLATEAQERESRRRHRLAMIAIAVLVGVLIGLFAIGRTDAVLTVLQYLLAIAAGAAGHKVFQRGR